MSSGKKLFSIYNTICSTLAIIFSLATLCFSAPPDEVAVDLAVATMVDGVTPNPTLFDCLKCKDTGWIIHGDGHQTKCPDCDLAKLPVKPTVVVKVFVPTKSKCSNGSCKFNYKSPIKPKTRWRWKR